MPERLKCCNYSSFNRVITEFISLVGVKACGKLTVQCHIAASLINTGDNDFHMIFKYGVVGNNQCTRHVGSTLCCASNGYHHPVFLWRDVLEWWARIFGNKLLALLRITGKIQLLLGFLRSTQWLMTWGSFDACENLPQSHLIIKA